MTEMPSADLIMGHSDATCVDQVLVLFFEKPLLGIALMGRPRNGGCRPRPKGKSRL